MPLTYVELFAGAGGLSLGLESAGFHPVAHCEIEPHARAVLRHRWPGVQLDGDVSQLDGTQFRGITLLSGGSPCQDLSVAGKRKGLAGARSGLFHEQVRVWQESDAPYFLWENVLGALSSNAGQDFATVLSTLVGAAIPVPSDGWRSGGVAAGPDAVAAWRVLDLQHFGPPQRRVRVFVLAAQAGGVDPAEVLALSESLCRHPSPREQARERTARGAAASTRGVGVKGFNSYQRTVEEVVSGVRVNSSSEAGVIAFGLDGEKNAHIEMMGTLNTGSKSGSGQQPAVIAFDTTQITSPANYSNPKPGDPSPTLTSLFVPAVVCTTGSVTHALTRRGDGSENGTGRGTPIVTNYARMVAFGEYATDGTASTIKQRDFKDATDLVFSGRPRRLTPLEAERLMSWPDGWTATGTKEDGTVYQLSDTARYRLCGNGVGSVCVAWFAKRLADAIHEQDRHAA